MITSENAIFVVLGVVLAAVVIARLITYSATQATTRECSACKSRVPKDARKCRHCGEALDGTARDDGADKGW